MIVSTTADGPDLHRTADELRAPAQKAFPPRVDGTRPTASRRQVFKRSLIVAAALAAAAITLRYGSQWYYVGRFQEVTDDAFLQADKVTVAPKIGGFVAQVNVDDNQTVRAGDVLARIDEQDYRITLAQDEAELDKAVSGVQSAAAALTQQNGRIAAARADLANARAALAFSEQEEARYSSLSSRGAGTAQRSQQAKADLAVKRAVFDKASANLDLATTQMDSLRSLGDRARATLRRAQIDLDQAKLALSHTEIVAPIDGVVGDRSVRKGQLVQAGTNLLTLVPMGPSIYIVANYKETQIGGMREGQPVTFTVDTFPGHDFHGHLASVAPGTGSQFALLPPENATGNFTKIVQRVPVKITLNAGDPFLARLRPGLSAEVAVDVRDEAPPALDEPSPARRLSR